jgi:hypothetical protein
VEQIILGIGAVSLVASLWALWQSTKLSSRFTRTLGGSDPKALEQTLTAYFENVRKVDAKIGKLTAAYHDISDMAHLASQKISVVRFNPFGDTGGDQSFVLAVLDAHNSGYVLTSIHGREGTRVYVKPVDLGKSKYTLSAEEKQAMNQAIKRTPIKEAQEDINGEKK